MVTVQGGSGRTSMVAGSTAVCRLVGIVHGVRLAAAAATMPRPTVEPTAVQEGEMDQSTVEGFLGDALALGGAEVWP
jgi:hypothetical protein